MLNLHLYYSKHTTYFFSGTYILKMNDFPERQTMPNLSSFPQNVFIRNKLIMWHSINNRTSTCPILPSDCPAESQNGKKRKNSRNDVWPCFSKSWKASTDCKNCLFALSSIDFKVDAYTDWFWSPAKRRGHNRKTQFGKTTLEMNYIFITMRSFV